MSAIIVVKYIYDAWGNYAVVQDTQVTKQGTTAQTSLAELNPIRYRSYYYDTETELYYLKTRYYDPKIGRFITIDDTQYLAPDQINGLNLYAYCGNNPDSFIDNNGTKPTVSTGVDIWSIINKSGYIWHSGRYTPQYIEYKYDLNNKNPFQNFKHNIVAAFKNFGMFLLSRLELSVISWSVKACSISNSGFTIISASVDLLEGKAHLSSTDYLGLKLGSASIQAGFDWGSNGLIGVEAQVTALTVGFYSQYVDAEILLGSIGFTAKWEQGALKLGAAFGWGVQITIRLW